MRWWSLDVLRDERVDLLVAQPAFDQVAVDDRLAGTLNIVCRALPGHQLAVIVRLVGKMAELLAREALADLDENVADQDIAGVGEIFLVAVLEELLMVRPLFSFFQDFV